jgi:DNA repair exonuclease SbcCD ATPase subunit
MIRRLHLHGWRSFEEQSLDIGPGVTFVLAENGVGKTSLIEAAAWALYGAASGVNAVAARRIGSAETRVEAEVELPDGGVLSIGRAVDRRGQTVVDATVGGAAVEPDTLPTILAEAYGASADFLARTTAVPSSAVADDSVGAFVLREHLCRVLGVDDLNRAAERLEALHEQAEDEAKGFRSATRRASADLAALTGQLLAADQQFAVLQEQQAVRRGALEQAEEQLRAARRWAETAQRVAAANAAFQQVRRAAQAVLSAAPAAPEARTIDALVAQLEDAERAALAGVDAARQSLAVLAGRVEAVTAAAAELDGVAGDCPVCRRPMSGDEVEHARRSHNADLAALHGQRTAQQDALGRATGQLADVRAVLRQALAVPAVVDEPAAAPLDVEAAQTAVDAARAGVEVARLTHDEGAAAVAAARGARSALADRIAGERAAADEREASLLAHRKAALARMAAKVARTSADQLLTERIDPLAAEVRSRWKRVFGDRGLLQLGADGRLTLRRGVDDIPFEYLSSGEKVVALLAVRLLVLGSSTQASFLWLDEPLEHLDPRNRRLAASLMSAAGTQVRQILVTTYEEDLARRLARRGQASILRVRSADATWPSTGA